MIHRMDLHTHTGAWRKHLHGVTAVITGDNPPLAPVSGTKHVGGAVTITHSTACPLEREDNQVDLDELIRQDNDPPGNDTPFPDRLQSSQ